MQLLLPMLLSVLCVWAMVLPSALANTHWQSPDYILNAFLEVALKNEFTQKVTPLKKWQAPIQVQMQYEHPNAARYQHLVNKHLLHLSQITQHPIYQAKDEASANLKVILTTEKRWENEYIAQFDQLTQRKLLTTVCMGKMQLLSDNTIVGGVVIIPVDRAIRHRKLVTCIVEELTQVMGLPNDSEKVYPSIFNDKTPDDLLSGLDYLLLKLLYQPTLKNNMTESDIVKSASPLLKKWQNEGLIQQASARVRQGALYQDLGFR